VSLGQGLDDLRDLPLGTRELGKRKLQLLSSFIRQGVAQVFQFTLKELPRILNLVR
jgi:hypothetical protein